MIKKLTKSGNSYALVLDRAILDLLKITPDTPLEITTNGRSITVTPVASEISDPEIKAAATRFKQKYGRMMKRLAE